MRRQAFSALFFKEKNRHFFVSHSIKLFLFLVCCCSAYLGTAENIMLTCIMDFHPDNRPIENIYAEDEELHYVAPPEHYLLTCVMDFHSNNLLIKDTLIKEKEDVFFNGDGVTAIHPLNINCGQMTYNFYDGGKMDSSIAENQKFTICPENPMKQRTVSIQFNEFNVEWEVSEFFEETVNKRKNYYCIDNVIASTL